MNFGTDDSHLYKQISFGIRACTDRTFEIHTEDTYSITRTDIFCGELFLWLLFGSWLRHLLFCFIEFLTKFLTFPFHGRRIYIIIMEFMEKLHGLICIIFCFLKNLVGFFVCLTDDAVFLNIQLFMFAF